MPEFKNSKNPQAMKNEKPKINLELTVEEVNLVLTALGQLPYVQVVGMVDKICKQAEVQTQSRDAVLSN
jgi:hypothetical protein